MTDEWPDGVWLFKERTTETSKQSERNQTAQMNADIKTKESSEENMTTIQSKMIAKTKKSNTDERRQWPVTARRRK